MTQNLERKGAANNSKSFARSEVVIAVMVALTPTHRVVKRLILQMKREVGFLNFVDHDSGGPQASRKVPVLGLGHDINSSFILRPLRQVLKSQLLRKIASNLECILR